MSIASPPPPTADPSAAPTTAPGLGRGLHALWSGQAGPRDPDGRPQPWDVVIVGTGYGGSAAAAALAGCTVADRQGGRRPIRLCILERGQELRPGDFPSRMADLPGHLRIGQQATGEALIAHCATLIGKHKLPRKIHFTDNLPLTASGKIQRFALRERARANINEKATK